MDILNKIKEEIIKEINGALGRKSAGVSDLVYPPNPGMGDLSLPAFNLAKEKGGNPAEIAAGLAAQIRKPAGVLETKAAGPYLNFILDKELLAGEVLEDIRKEKGRFGRARKKAGKIMVEFAHPNTHKAFHIGHLRNIITGEAVARLLEAGGHKVIRANYQGDVGLHIAKCLWGVERLEKEYETAKKDGVDGRAVFLGKAYAFGSQNYEDDGEAKKEIIGLNKKIYDQDKSIRKLYQETRQWSLDYFAKIYRRVNTRFDRLYFESETFASGKAMVLKSLERGIFKRSDGAVIFEGEKYGLHNRVFINSEGNPTYEGKDVGLAALQFKEYKPEKIIHVVGPEQAEYFKVVFKALELILPEHRGEEIHLPYGWVRLKEGKMSSRLGNVILGEWLLDEVKKEILKIVENSGRLKDKGKTAEKIALGAVKYSILKNGLTKDIAFDINESISLSGNSGPYLQYTYARINSILKKAGRRSGPGRAGLKEEKELGLVLALAKYPEAVTRAGERMDPSEIAKYLFELAQSFNDYYHSVPVLKAEKAMREARLRLIGAISQVLENGMGLLGMETVTEM